MRITETLSYSTVQIRSKLKDGSTGFGTGFFIALKKDGKDVLLIVTNKHVIKDALTSKFIVTVDTGENPSKTKHEIDLLAGKWIPHPEKNVDLCCLDVTEMRPLVEKKDGVKWRISPFTREQILSKDDCAKYAPTDEVFMVGYPDAIRDRVYNQPIFRRGVFATNPGLDFEGRPEVLVDMAVFNGSSGSPVLVLNSGLHVEDETVVYTPPQEADASLFGVAFAACVHNAEGELVPVPIALMLQTQTEIPNNLGVVVKAYKILDFEALI